MQNKEQVDALSHAFDDWNDEPSSLDACVRATKNSSVEVKQPMPVTPSNLVVATEMSDHEAIGRSQDASSSIPFPFRDKPEHFPGFMARSSLFRVGRPSSAVVGSATQPLLIKAQGGYIITFHGERLTMHDKLVWEVAIQMAKEATPDMNALIQVSLREFSRRLGWTDQSGKALDWIWQSLRRLYMARVEFRFADGREGGGSMLATVIKSDGALHIRVNPDFALPAFGHDKQFRIRFERRRGLKSSLAQWLHDFLSTHSTTHDLTLDYLRELCGFQAKKSRFPLSLVEALNELKTAIPELIESFEIDKAKRDSDHWILRIKRGPETPEFIIPGAKWKNSPNGERSAKERGLAI